MDINKKALELANSIKSIDEFKLMKKSKSQLDKNKNLKRQLDNYIDKKNKLYSNNRIEDASSKLVELNKEYQEFFNLPLVSSYMKSTRDFNNLMEKVYKSIEKELLK